MTGLLGLVLETEGYLPYPKTYDPNDYYDAIFLDYMELHTNVRCIDDYQNSDKIYIHECHHMNDDYMDILEQVVAKVKHNPKVEIFTTNAYPINFGIRTHHSPFLFNRTAAYYTNYQVINRIKYRWHHLSNESYSLQDVDLFQPRSKKYISANRQPRTYREKLVSMLYENHLEHEGYISYLPKNIFLDGQDPKLNHLLDPEKNGSYIPLHNKYYNDTFASIYGETTTNGNRMLLPTEKTYDPLIKGHWIIPFSNPNFIAHLQSMGFRFPEIIDYSYDKILDYDERLNAFLEAVKNFINTPIQTLQNKWEEDLPNILYNRSLFWGLKKTIS